MRKIKLKSVSRFQAGSGKSVHFYCLLKNSALAYKYRGHKGLIVSLQEKDLWEDPVWIFKESDKIPIAQKGFLDGKKLRELYVTSIFVCLLDNTMTFDNFKVRDKTISIGYPSVDTGVDSFISVSEKTFEFMDNGKIAFGIAGKSSLFYQIQVKEYFNFAESLKVIQSPKPFNLNQLKPKRLKSYNEIILVYIRSFTEIIFKDLLRDIEAAGLKEKRIILIGTVAGSEIPREYTFWDLRNQEEYTTKIPICNLFYTFEELTGLKPNNPNL